MYNVHTDSDQKRFVIVDRHGKVYARLPFPDQESQLVLVPDSENYEAFQAIWRLVRFANAGKDEVKRAKREIAKLQCLVEDLGE